MTAQPSTLPGIAPTEAEPAPRRVEASRMKSEPHRSPRGEWEMIYKSRYQQMPEYPTRQSTQKVLDEIEWLARLNPYAFPSNKHLTNKTGVSLWMVNDALGILEATGWIKPVWAGPGGRQRRGFVLLRRITKFSRAADTPEAIAKAEEFLRNRTRKGQAQISRSKERPPECDGSHFRECDGSHFRECDGSHLNNNEGGIKTKLNAAGAAEPAAAASRPTSSEAPKGSMATESPAIPDQLAEPAASVEPVPPPAELTPPIAAPPAELTPPIATPPAEVLDVAAWAKAIRPELEQLVLAWGVILPLLWVRTLIEHRVMSNPKNRPGSKLIAYLSTPLSTWKRTGKCDLIENSTLENPSGKPNPVTHFEADPAQLSPVLTATERQAKLAELDSPHHVPFWRRPNVAALV